MEQVKGYLHHRGGNLIHLGSENLTSPAIRLIPQSSVAPGTHHIQDFL